MAFDDYDDYEKSELVSKWLRENATAIISGIVLGLLLIFGINQWRNHQATHRFEAANQYQLMLNALQDDDQTAATAAANALQREYKNTAFAVFSALQEAQQAVTAGKPDNALVSLNWASHHARNEAIKALAQLRLSRVQLATGKADAAIKTLDALPKGYYEGMAASIRGDALVALKQNDAARTAYQSALDSFEPTNPVRNMVQLKLDNLASGKRDS